VNADQFIEPAKGAKLLNAFERRTNTTTTNQQQYYDSFNRTESNSNVTSDTGNTTVNLGESGGSSWVDKVLPAVVIGALVIAGIVALRGTK
jgi:hypothetical protein